MMKKKLGLFLLVILASANIIAQHKVTGKVVDEVGDPIPGVNVIEVGNVLNGTITNMDGIYNLTVEADKILSFSFIGFSDQEIAVDKKFTINVNLISDVTGLDEVVVTALGIRREKKSVGYSIQEINSEQLNSTMDPTISGALQGKVAGVQIDGSAGGVGTSSKITIRGNSSLSGGNEPLWIVDGVPLNDGQISSQEEYEGIDYAGSAQDINPDNIETISVLKGATAAALYGSRAANGVILVTTKKGLKRDGVGVSYSSSFTVDQVYKTLDFQEKYGQGNNGKFAIKSGTSWGPEMTGQMIPSYIDKTTTYAMEPHMNKVDDFYRTGLNQTHNVALFGGNEKLTTRVNIGYNKVQGISKRHELEKFDFSARISGEISDFIDIDVKANYIRSNGENRPAGGRYGALFMFMKVPASIRTEELSQYVDANQQQQHYVKANSNNRNPYYILNSKDVNDSKHRLLGTASINFNLSENLKFKITQGLDHYDFLKESATIPDTKLGRKGVFRREMQQYREENTEARLTFNKKINDFSLMVSSGANRMYTKTTILVGTSKDIVVPNYYFIGNGEKNLPESRFSEKEIQSVYALGQIGYKSKLFLDITARNDWSSTLPKENWSFFYPSFSMSALLSEILTLPDYVTFAKVRAGYSMVGNDTNPYQLSSSYTLGDIAKSYQSLPYPMHPATIALEDLKAEKTTSWEMGLDLKLFNNRLGFDVTYYQASTKNQILTIPIAQSTGFVSKRINAGEITNKGLEIMCYGSPVKNDNWQVDLTLNWSKNEGFTESLDSKLKEYDLGGLTIANVVAREGHAFGDIRGTVYMRNEAGQKLINSKGLPLINTTTGIVGNITPDWIGSLRTDVSYKNLVFAAQLNIKQGGDVVSSTEAFMAGVGTAKITEDRSMRVIEGVRNVSTTDQPEYVNNDIETSAQHFYRLVGGNNGVAEEFVYDASYIKLQELSIGYKLSKSMLSKIKFIQSGRFSVVGRNLGYLSKNTPGNPEAFRTRSIGAQATDFAGVANTRTYGFNLSLNF